LVRSNLIRELYLDITAPTLYSKLMRWQAVIVIAAIALSMVVPPAFLLSGAYGTQTAIGTLDICHSATPALSSNGEMPCLHECTSIPLPVAQYHIAKIENSPLKPIFIAFQVEHPPKS
jgi:hypothetical protein